MVAMGDGVGSAATLSTRALWQANRGGGLVSEYASTWLGAAVAVPLARRRVRPSTVTLVALAVGLAASALAIVAVAHAHPLVSSTVTLVALVGWQGAYVLDCTDGTVARATGTASAHGARLDVLCDLAVQSGVVATVVRAVDGARLCPSWLQALFAITWTVNLFVGTLARIDGRAGHSLLNDERSAFNQAARLARDYPFQALVLALALVRPHGALPWVVVAFVVLHGGFLVASIANEARLAFAATRSMSPAVRRRNTPR
jgi:phosphatidylglycerophosphate synthase